MLGITLKESRFYQDAKVEGEISLIIRQLRRKLRKLPETLIAKIEALSLEQVNELGEELLDFCKVADLEQ